MTRPTIILGLLLFGFAPAVEAASDSTGSQQSEGSKGVTVEDLGRGLKSAAQNVEKEIPKIGSAIGETIKKITEKSPEKSQDKKPAQEPAKEKK